MDRETPPLSFTARIVALLAIPLLSMTLLSPSTSAQEDAPPTPAPAPTLPSEALTFGAALEENTSPKLLDWAKKHARAALRKQFNADELSPEKFATLFPAESPPVREAIRFLAGYQAYRRANDQQQKRAARIRDLDRAIRDLEDGMRMMEAAGAPIGSIAAAQRNAALAAGQRRMEDLELQRKVTAGDQSDSKLVDATLRWLADTYPAVKDTPADALRSTPPPRN